MKAEKRSGGYRVQPMKNGKRYSLTFDHKPSKKDIEEAIADIIEREKQRTGHSQTFKMASDRYTESKKNVISASTYTDYKRMPSRFPEWFVNLKIDDITQDDINRLVNELALNRSPKTVRNYHGYVSAILGTYRPSFNISTTLPLKAKNKPYIPSDDDVRKLVDASIGTDYEIAIKLMCYGLRRSEVCAITADDIEDDILHINKTKVYSIDKGYIIQNRNKVEASTRDIVISKDLAKDIMKKGYAYKGNPNNIYKFISRTEEKLGIEHFSAHKLRHYFASKMSSMGISEADILEMGGWETDHVMKSVYRHAMIKEEHKRKISNQLTENLF